MGDRSTKRGPEEDSPATISKHIAQWAAGGGGVTCEDAAREFNLQVADVRRMPCRKLLID